MRLIKQILFLVAFVLVLTFSIQSVSAESKYTREKSEALFHLIEWQEYGPETFENALKEQKPIYLVLSAPSWCYWCHVYESKDFLYDDDLYHYINENFIPIFIDSDKRPDLTKKYLEGGWPSTTIFTPDLVRVNGFVGPREPKALKKYLVSLIAFLEDKKFSEQFIDYNYEEVKARIPDKEQLLHIENNFIAYSKNIYDPVYGGFGPGDVPAWREGQKFPRGLTQKLLLENYAKTSNKELLDIVKNTFKNQYTDISQLETRYRLYDPVEGGYHRYSTKRNWSMPHYEKMLADQAKFILALTDLQKYDKSKEVQIALSGTVNFVINSFYDEKGGFYSSQDAYLEEEYYGHTKEERDKIDPPYIDKTIRISSNSMMISSFIYIYLQTNNTEYKNIAKKSLDFIKENMIGEEGVYFYYDNEKKEAFLTGQSISNAWPLLTFIDAYEAFSDKEYLKTAEKIAIYSHDNLYDWAGAGFFERNSKDLEFYALNEVIDLNKPYAENAVFSYAMLRLYLITEKLQYLESGLNSLGYVLDKSSGLEETYYAIKASQLVIENDLLNVYGENDEKLLHIREAMQSNFFFDLIKQKSNPTTFEGVPQLKDEFSSTGFIILVILAFAAGIISFLSPCTLPILTAYFAHSANSKKGEIFKKTIYFFLGLALVFSIFGMGASYIGSIFKENRAIFTQVAGIIIILFGFLSIFGKGFSGFKLNFRFFKSKFGSFFLGIFFAIGWSACIGPILASVLILSATSGTILKGSILLLIYAIGLALPLIILSMYLDRIKNKRFWKIINGKEFKIGKFTFHTTQIISGIILILLGILIFNDFLFKLNQYSLGLEYVQSIVIGLEDFLKNILIK